MSDERHILVIAHTGRADSLEAGIQVCRQLTEAGLTPVISTDEVADMMGAAPDLKVTVLGEDVASHELELVIVLGGDGTILRAAEIARGCDAPLLGVNLGHVGFLAEAEREDLPATVARVLARDYEVEERMTISVRVKLDDEVVHETWALNEASVEKASRERSLEVVVEVDGRPLSTFGCDGVVMSTPTGSTAYSFSAGGPVVWPSVDALLMVPLSAHALFARPLVVGPDSSLAVELLERSVGTAGARSTFRAARAWSCGVHRCRCAWRGSIRARSPTASSTSSACQSPDGADRGTARDRRDLDPRPRRDR
jgi:NAD+ kinase